MPLSRTERFKLKSRIVTEVSDPHSWWDHQRINLLLGEFGLGKIVFPGPSFEDLIANISDSDLVQMYSIVTGIDLEEVAASVESAESGNWKLGYVRLFVSHSASQREFVGKVADELALIGIHGFVAHDTMKYDKPWQAQIEVALRSMQAFVAIVHPEFNESAWCHQETGWALGRRVPKYAIRMGVAPAGFLGHDQWPSGNDLSPKQVGSLIGKWLTSVPELGEAIVDGLFSALESVGNYIDAGATADRITNLDSLTAEQWTRLDEIYWKNDQLHTGALPSRALKPFYRWHGREWPPPKPAPAETSQVSVAGTKF